MIVGNKGERKSNVTDGRLEVERMETRGKGRI